MRKMRFGAMAATVGLAVAVFLGAQRLAWLPGPWSEAKTHFFTTRFRPPSAPDDYMTYYSRGVRLQQQGQYEKALVNLDEAVRLSPESLTASQLGARAFNTRLAETHTMNLVVFVRLARAEVLEALNQPDEALVDLDKAIAVDYRKVEAIYTRGMLRAITGRYDGALADFNTLLDRHIDPDWLFGRGFVNYLKGDWAAATADFQDLVRIAPNDRKSWVWLTKAQLRSGDPILPAQRASLGTHLEAAPIIDAYGRDHDAGEFIAGVLAGASTVGGDRHRRQCGAALFLGEWLTLHKAGVGARDMFTQAEAICTPLSIEHATAAAELKRATVLAKDTQ